MSIILRILTGVHKDAQIELTPGDWEVGSDALCDILLSDVSPHQATLKVLDDGKVLLLPKQDEDVSNFFQGSLVPVEGVEVPQYTCISFGQVHAAIGDANINQWPNIVIPATQDNDDLSEDNASAERDVQKVNESSQKLSFDNTAINYNAQKTQNNKRIFLRIALVLLLFILCIGGVSTLTGPSKAELQLQDIEAVLHGLESGYLAVKESENSVWHVSGGVRDNQTQHDLEQALKGLPFEVKTELFSLADTAQSLEAHIKAEGSVLRVQVVANGLSIAGYVYDEKSLAALLKPMQDILKNVSLTKNITYYNKISHNLEASLTSLGLQSVVRLTPGPYAILLESSALSAEQKKNFNIFIQEVTGMTKGIIPFVKPKAKPVSAAKKADVTKIIDTTQDAEFCSSLKLGSQGSKMYIVYQDKNYNQGARLPNGFVVQEVRETYSTFVKNDLLVYCPH